MISRRGLLSGFAVAAVARQARAADAPITLAVSSNSLAYGGLRIAEKAGLFEQNGLSLSIKVMESGSAATAAVISGSIDVCSASLGEVLAARVHGQSIRVIANTYRGLSGSLVLSKSTVDRLGLTASAPLDVKLKALAGLSVATPSATSSYTFPFRIAGQAAGAQPRFVYMGQPAMVAALKTGAIQGLIAGAPYSTEAVASGDGVLWVNGPKGELPAEVTPTSSAAFETSDAYALARPDVVARFRAALAALSTLIKDRPPEAQRLMALAYPQLTPETIASVFASDGLNWAQPVMTIDDIRHEIVLQQKAGVLKGVEKVDPASVLAP